MNIALIPCRSGSKRVPLKNFRSLGGKPLVNWTVEAAVDSGLFDSIWLCTDAPDKALEAICSIDREQLISVLEQKHPLHRDDCRDIEWITDALDKLKHRNHLKGSVCAPCSLGSDCFEDVSIYLLRPTSPFRGATSILRAHEQWEACKDRLDSLRAVRKATEPAWKQWTRSNENPFGLMVPVIPNSGHLHSRPTQTLPQCYIQTAALEVFHYRTIRDTQTIAGERVGMFLTEGQETVNIDTPEDWEEAERLATPILLEPSDSYIRGL